MRDKEKIIEILHQGGYSCVIENSGEIYTFTQRGVKDLFTILKESPEIMKGAFIADKVIGKGAAALMILGGVEEIYADVISNNAIKLLQDCKIMHSFAKSVPHIINRNGDGVCPVETLCNTVNTPEECLPLIENFLNR